MHMGTEQRQHKGCSRQQKQLWGPVLLCNLLGFNKTYVGAAGGLPYTKISTEPRLRLKCLQM